MSEFTTRINPTNGHEEHLYPSGNVIDVTVIDNLPVARFYTLKRGPSEKGERVILSDEKTKGNS